MGMNDEFEGLNDTGRRYLFLTDEMPFGKYKGALVKTVAREDPEYIDWAQINVDWIEFDDEVMDLVQESKDEDDAWADYGDDFFGED